jgi:hypothetical protein
MSEKLAEFYVWTLGLAKRKSYRESISLVRINPCFDIPCLLQSWFTLHLKLQMRGEFVRELVSYAAFSTVHV